MWIYSALATYWFWGLIALIIGVAFLGVGVFPIAVLASLINADWVVLGSIFYMALLTYGSRMIGAWLIGKADEESYNKEQEQVGIEENRTEESKFDESSNIYQADVFDEKTSENKFCIHCGKEISKDAKFCKYCGKEIKIN